MAIDLTDADHGQLDAFTARQVTRMEAMSAFAHVITAAGIGNEGELRGWLKPETVVAWIRRCDGGLCPLCRKKPCVLVEHFGGAL